MNRRLLFLIVGLSIIVGSVRAQNRPVTKPANCQCGIKGNGNRIMGGINAAKKEFPWQVSFVFGGIHRFCGGTLITNKHVLTAAHCFYTEVLNYLRFITIRLGDYSNDKESTEQERKIKGIVRHPDFNRTSIMDNDFAIIEMDREVDIETVGNGILPACLPNEGSNDNFAGHDSIVTGWGELSFYGEEKPSILQRVVIPVLTNTVCNQKYGNMVTSNMLCAGLPQGGKDACFGDEGGPLVVKSDSNKYIVAGVTSWGAFCSTPDLPGIYARVTAQNDWIRENIQTGKMCRN